MDSCLIQNQYVVPVCDITGKDTKKNVNITVYFSWLQQVNKGFIFTELYRVQIITSANTIKFTSVNPNQVNMF